MALKAVLQSLDGVDEALGAHYAKNEEDGRFYLAIEGIDEMPAVTGLKKSKQQILDEKKQLEQRLDALGVKTPEEVQELREKAKNAGGQKAEEIRAEFEGKIKQITERTAQEVAEAKKLAEAEQNAAREYFLTGEITRAVTAAGGVPELVGHVIRDHLKVERGEDGKFRLSVLGKDGQPRIKDSQGNPFGLDDLVGELREDDRFGRAFDASGAGGSGAPPGGGSGGRGGISGAKPFKEMTDGDKREFIRKHGQQKFLEHMRATSK